MTTEASIIAQIPSYLSTAADGTRTLNKEGLRTWITAQMKAACGTNDYAKSQVAGAVSPLLDKLAAVFEPAYWAKRSGWPLNSTDTSNSRAATVATALAALKAAARRVTSDYLAVVAKTEANISLTFDAGIAPYIPPPVTRLVDSRFYVTTLVTDWGEESAPSPVSTMLEPDQNDTVTIAHPTGYATDRNIIGWRLYRSSTGSAGTNFQFVDGTLNADGTTNSGWDTTNDCFYMNAGYTDGKKGVELGEVLPSLTWLPPPVQELPETMTTPTPYLRGLTGMANGVMTGFYDNTVCFCEPYVPYAWPVEYQLTTKYPIVGLGSFGQTLFVGTTGTPYLISGADSASMSSQELPGNQSCSSARSIASHETGVLYASPDGICLADYSGVKVLTQGLFTKDDWSAINPSSIVGVMHHGVYYFLYDGRATTTLPQSQAVTIGMDPTAVQTAVTALFIELKTLIWNGAEPAAIALYNAKQLEFGFTDAELAPYTAFTAAQITAWKTSTGAGDVEAAFKALYAGLKQMIWEGNELLAKAVYNQKQLAYKFTDEQFHHFTDFSAAQIGEWKSNYNITPVANATGQWPNKVIRAAGCYALDFVTGKLTEVDIQGTAFFVDIQSDTLYMLDGTDIKALFTDTTQKRTGEYWTGIYKLPNQQPMAWLQVDAVFTTAVRVKWYGDGVLRYTASVMTNSPVRLPPGRYLEHQVMIESVDRITMVTLASSTEELKAS